MKKNRLTAMGIAAALVLGMSTYGLPGDQQPGGGKKTEVKDSVIINENANNRQYMAIGSKLGLRLM